MEKIISKFRAMVQLQVIENEDVFNITVEAVKNLESTYCVAIRDDFLKDFVEAVNQEINNNQLGLRADEINDAITRAITDKDCHDFKEISFVSHGLTSPMWEQISTQLKLDLYRTHPSSQSEDAIDYFCMKYKELDWFLDSILADPRILVDWKYPDISEYFSEHQYEMILHDYLTYVNIDDIDYLDITQTERGQKHVQWCKKNPLSSNNGDAKQNKNTEELERVI